MEQFMEWLSDRAIFISLSQMVDFLKIFLFITKSCLFLMLHRCVLHYSVCVCVYIVSGCVLVCTLCSFYGLSTDSIWEL